MQVFLYDNSYKCDEGANFCWCFSGYFNVVGMDHQIFPFLFMLPASLMINEKLFWRTG
jgi:hypothetical protein